MAVPYTFGSATTSIPLSQLDSNFATTITLGNTAIQLGNTVTTLNNMTLGNVTISSGTSSIQTNVANATGVLLEANGGTGTTIGYNGFKNRIINGAMVIDQRNAGAASANTINDYWLDRWTIQQAPTTGKLIAQQNAGSVTPPAGFPKYLGITSQSAYTVASNERFSINQPIEGFNFADLAWGTASAATVTLSFWVYSSLTGTFGGCVQNYAGNRSYPFNYTINSANTWEKKSVTIAGDQSGTWVGATNAGAAYVILSLGTGSNFQTTANAWAAGNYQSPTGATSVVGTNGATFYITGVQLEKGSTATSFDYRPYTTELQLCQRYYYRAYSNANRDYFGFAYSTSLAIVFLQFPVTMRTTPATMDTTVTASNYQVYSLATVTNASSVPALNAASPYACNITVACSAVLTAGQGIAMGASLTSYYYGFSAEL